MKLSLLSFIAIVGSSVAQVCDRVRAVVEEGLTRRVARALLLPFGHDHIIAPAPHQKVTHPLSFLTFTVP